MITRSHPGVHAAPAAPLRGVAALLAAFLVSLLCSACAAKQETPVAPPGAQPVAVAAPVTDETPVAVETVPGESAPAARTYGAAARTYGAAERTDGATARKSEVPAARTVSPASQMLASAGRDAGDTQPEAGFMLRVPETIGDGEAFLVAFDAVGARDITLTWRGKTVRAERDAASPGPLQALLPVALDEKTKTLPLTMTVRWEDGRTERFSADMPVKKRKYPVQSLKVDQKFVTPPPEMADKIKRDRAEMRAAVTKVSPRRYWNLPLLRPVPGEVTSLYGLRRVFNGQSKSPHKGVDFDAATGDPIAAVEDGVVVLVSEQYYGGNTVVVDHGLGVFSAYLHLSAFSVSVGQTINRGETIGLIGSTGRVTGPHLHLSLYVLGESVNAAASIAM